MLGCIQPMSSPMMKRILGFFVCAVPWHTPTVSKRLTTVTGPRAHFRVFALKCMVVSFGSELRFVGNDLRKKFEANYGAPLNKAKADSIGGIFDDQVRCQLVAGKRREV